MFRVRTSDLGILPQAPHCPRKSQVQRLVPPGETQERFMNLRSSQETFGVILGLEGLSWDSGKENGNYYGSNSVMYC